jgi:Tol biopolymer transport system component
VKEMKKLILGFMLLSYFFGGCGCNPCEPEFERNPQLRRLVSYHLRDCYNPVFSLDGERIYYLRTREYGSFFFEGGQLRCINIDGTNDRLILDGNYGTLAISSNGEKLALTIDAGYYKGGRIGIVDTSGANFELLDTSSDSIIRVEFSQDCSSLFFCDHHSKYSRINLDGTSETELFESQANEGTYGFDVSNEDKLIVFSDFIERELRSFIYSLNDSSKSELVTHVGGPQFSPINRDIILYCPTNYSMDGFRKINIQTGAITNLDSRTYKYSCSKFPYWSWDGKKIVFAGSELSGDPLGPEDYEIWVVE